MKKKTFLLLLGVTVILTVSVYLLADPYPSIVPAILGFPFRQLIALMRLLSKQGKIGNGFSVALLTLVSSLPALFALRYKNERTTIPERVVLFLLTPVLFVVLFQNGGGKLFSEGSPLVWGNRSISVSFDSLFGTITIWAVILLYLTLRLIRKIRSGEKTLLLRYFRCLLIICGILLTVSVTASALALISEFSSFAEARNCDRIMCFVRLLPVVPYLLDIAVIFLVIRYFDAQSQENGLSDAGRRLSRMCCLSLSITVAASAIVNLTQYVLCYYLHEIPTGTEFSFDFPVYPLIIVFAILLYVHMAKENRELIEDNSLFI